MPTTDDDPLASTGFDATLGLTLTSYDGDEVTATLTVTPALLQPYGIVHGGVYCSVIETVASVGGAMWYGDRGQVVGVSNHTNFLRAVREGTLTVRATPVTRGRTQQLWTADVTEESGRLVATGQVRLACLPADGSGAALPGAARARTGWDLLVDRADLTGVRLVDADPPTPGDGEAVLRVDRVGVTANNVTYAVLGDSMRYWEFFPSPAGTGRVPLWGYADVVASRAPGVEVGARVYGYLPSSSHLLVRPERVSPAGFRDGSAHRATLPSPYQAYAISAPEDGTTEDLQTLYRPLFTTSWMLADSLAEVPAERLLLSSASSKTAYGTAHLLRGTGRHVVGLTSERHRGFVEGLGTYDEVLAYDEVGGLQPSPTAYVDLSGDPSLRTSVRSALGGSLVADLVVGVTHHEAAGGALGVGGEPRPRVFFAPDRIAQRTREWGREGYEQRLGQAWEGFRAALDPWVTVVHSAGPEGLRAAWLEVLGGGSDPATGLVVTLGP